MLGGEAEVVVEEARNKRNHSVAKLSIISSKCKQKRNTFSLLHRNDFYARKDFVIAFIKDAHLLMKNRRNVYRRKRALLGAPLLPRTSIHRALQ